MRHEAGNCFAFERFTAAVYHLMRVAEHGLVAVSVAAHVPSPEMRSWDKMIAGIHSHVNRLASQKADGWKADERKFSDLNAWFTSIKNGWRNPVSHIPRIYSEDTARGIFVVMISLFDSLSHHGFIPVQMPPVPIVLPEDDV